MAESKIAYVPSVIVERISTPNISCAANGFVNVSVQFNKRKGYKTVLLDAWADGTNTPDYANIEGPEPVNHWSEMYDKEDSGTKTLIVRYGNKTSSASKFTSQVTVMQYR